MCCFYCLLVHIMYIIHNKATFTVIEIINPNIRTSKKFTINNHLLALEYIEYLKDLVKEPFDGKNSKPV